MKNQELERQVDAFVAGIVSVAKARALAAAQEALAAGATRSRSAPATRRRAPAGGRAPARPPQRGHRRRATPANPFAERALGPAVVAMLLALPGRNAREIATRLAADLRDIRRTLA